jgi:hypothetical protein
MLKVAWGLSFPDCSPTKQRLLSPTRCIPGGFSPKRGTEVNNPRDIEVYNNRVKAYASVGKLEKAEADFAKAEELGYEPD